ncbi:hypothetical protein L6164_006442 [Bauhinia variegata]|uniref:Uncharacterized protein n=1 Tax=Bauhinia variegata TaxID=167791 RepID=A0ACB9PVW4_BAUVA|nr:hypothetical protein L6164_006442 [Bauhinia variegata]
MAMTNMKAILCFLLIVTVISPVTQAASRISSQAPPGSINHIYGTTAVDAHLCDGSCAPNDCCLCVYVNLKPLCNQCCVIR